MAHQQSDKTKVTYRLPAPKPTFPCPYCALVYYAKNTLTKHINEEHWKEAHEDEQG